MQLGNATEGQTCGKCGHKIKKGAVIKDDRLCHDVCPEEGQKDIRRADEVGARYGFAPFHTSSAP